MIIKNKNLNEVSKEIIRLKKEDKEIVVIAQDDDFNRKIVENSNVDVLLGLEIHDRKDYLKQRDSGLNEILCRLAKKNNVKIGIDLKNIVKLNNVEKAKVLSRVRQNIKLCRRVGTEIIVYGNGFSKLDIKSFLISLGASSQQTKII